jgi:hypothetical protein
MTLGGHKSMDTARYYIRSLAKEAIQSHRKHHLGHQMGMAQKFNLPEAQ